MMTFKRKLIIAFTAILALGLLLPGRVAVPVENATAKDWNVNSFWYEPWGKSGVHKGIDIFAINGSRVISSNYGLVIFTGNIKLGGNVVVILGPKWRIHYYAHLNSITAKTFDFAGKGDIIGSVGNSGNAKGKSPHLHYSVFSIIPYPWRFSTETQGWKKMFFMNPAESI